MPIIDLTGQRFGRWVVLKKAPPRPQKGGSYWVCQGDCGTVSEVYGKSLRKGSSSSCGCWRKEWASATNAIHGMCKTRLYRTWSHMMDRCYRPRTRNYQRYGGRNISVCDEWHSFLGFAEWALNNGYSDNLTIDRVDNNGNYCPQNCRWVDYTTQANNRSNNHLVSISGETKTIAEWSRIYGIDYSLIRQRMYLGWDEEKAITTPKRVYQWQE